MENLYLLIAGIGAALTWPAPLYIVTGVTLGMVIGVLPGIGPMTAISLILPITFTMSPSEGLIMLAGIYYGAQYGGSITSILLNLPGDASAAAACLDGHPMARNGRAGAALFLTTVGSFFGAMVGILPLILFAPALASVALSFGPAEYVAIMTLGLLAAATLADGSVVRGLMMVAFGMLLGSVGSDLNTGMQRFSFGLPLLFNGIGIVMVAMGFFGLSEVLSNLVRPSGDGEVRKIGWRDLWPTRQEFRTSIKPALRGSLIGSFFGLLPGTGTAISAFVAYLFEKRISRHPEKFGHGAVEGVTAPEAANNATAQSSFIPTLTLGIPGDGVMALMLGAMMIFGIQTGPYFITNNGPIFWGLVASFFIGNIILVILNIPFIGVWVRLLSVPYKYICPLILVMIGIGVYTIQNEIGDIVLVALLGLFGYILKCLDFKVAPLLLGFVLGPLLEENLRRMLVVSRGDFLVLLERPISAAFIAASVLVLILGLLPTIRRAYAAAGD